MHNHPVDVAFISPDVVRAARAAAALDQRIGGKHFEALTISVDLYGRGWSLDDNSDAFLRNISGGSVICSPFRPVPDRLPDSLKAASEARHAAGQELRQLLAALPFNGDALRIPLHAAA